jgi:hypothetical protein
VIDYSKKSFKELKEYVFTQTTKKYEIEKQKESKAIKLGKEIAKVKSTKIFTRKSEKFAGFTSNKVYFENEEGDTDTLWEEIQSQSADLGDTITLNVVIYFRKIGTNKVIATEVNMDKLLLLFSFVNG